MLAYKEYIYVGNLPKKRIFVNIKKVWNGIDFEQQNVINTRKRKKK